MNASNTPVHIKLWHKDLWCLVFANFFLMASVYVLLPVLPMHLLGSGSSHSFVAQCLLAYTVGLYLPGAFVSGWVQRHKRNRVSVTAMLLLAGLWAFFYFIGSLLPWVIIAASMLTGSLFAVAQMVLTSTLVVDTCESIHRTEANYAASWFGRFALALGPCAGYWMYAHHGLRSLLMMSIVSLLLSVFLINLIRFPFKAPDETMRRVSLDRFFLVHGTPLFLNLLLITASLGLIVSTQLTSQFFLMMMGGFMLAILSEKYVFANAELKSESVAGCLFIGAAILLLWLRHSHSALIMASVLCGFGIGIIGSRFLLFFIKLARHCERGTSQSTFFLGWETGLAMGLAGGWLLADKSHALLLALVLVAVALVLYNNVIHPWYLHNKNR